MLCWLVLAVTGELRSQGCWVTSGRSRHQRGLTWLRHWIHLSWLSGTTQSHLFKDICDSVGQGLLQEKLRVLGSVWGDLTQICLGSAIATALEQWDLGDCVHQGVCRHTAFMALQTNLQYNLVKWGWERSTSFGNKQQSQSKCCALWASSRNVLFGLARFWWSTLLHNGYFVIKMHPGLESEVLAFCGELIEFCSLRMEQSQMEHINHLFGVSELYQSTCLNSFPFGSSIETKE